VGFIDSIRYAYYVTHVNVRESTRFDWFKLLMKLWLSLTIIINYIIQWYQFSLICLTKQEKNSMFIDHYLIMMDVIFNINSNFITNNNVIFIKKTFIDDHFTSFYNVININWILGCNIRTMLFFSFLQIQSSMGSEFLTNGIFSLYLFSFMKLIDLIVNSNNFLDVASLASIPRGI